MHADHFEARLAIVRHRFAATLESKIENVAGSADRMFRGDDGVSELVAESYRRLHGICGIAPTVGFTSTSEAARAAEDALVLAHQEQRGLTEPEFDQLSSALDRLREAAASELRSMYGRGGCSHPRMARSAPRLTQPMTAGQFDAGPVWTGYRDFAVSRPLVDSIRRRAQQAPRRSFRSRRDRRHIGRLS